MSNCQLGKIIAGISFAALLLLAGCGGSEQQQQYLENAQQYLQNQEFEKAKIETKKILELNSDNAEAWYLLGLISEQEKDLQSAFGSFSLAVKSDPSHIKSLLKITRYYLMSKQLDKALETANLAVSVSEKNPDVLSNLATVYAAQGNSDQAIEKARMALSVDPGNIRATTVLTGIYARDNPELALEIIAGAIASQTKNESLKLLKIRLLYSQGRRDEVVAIYKELIAEYPEKILYPFQLVNFHLRNESNEISVRRNLAEQILRELVVKKPAETQVKLWLVEFLIKNRSLTAGKDLLQEYVVRQPENFKLRDQLAKIFLREKNINKAKALYNHVVENDPSGADGVVARNRLAAIAMVESDRDKAADILQQVFTIDPENSEALIIRAKLKLTSGNNDGAISDLRLAQKKAPDSVETLALLGIAHEKNNLPDIALENYRRLLEIKPDDMSGLLGAARVLIEQNKLQQALPMLESARKVNPLNIEVVRQLTDIYSRDQRWDDALSVSAKLTELDSTMALGYYLQGRIYLRKKEFKSALNALKKSHEIEPRGVETLSALVGNYIALDQLDEALVYVGAHIKKYPEQIHARELMGNLHARNGDMAAATTWYQEVIALAPERLSSYQALSRVFLAQGRLDDIEKLYRDGLAKNPDSEGLLLLLAELYQARGDFHLAVNTYDHLLQLNPGSLVVKNNLAAILLDHFNTPANLSRAEQLTEDFADTENPAFLDTAGWVQYQLENYPSAIKLLSAARNFGGQGAAYHYHLGMALYKAGMKTDAREQLELALADKRVNFSGRDTVEEILGHLTVQVEE